MDQDQYKTKILNIAAFLYASGLQLATTSKIGSEIFFIFRGKDEANRLVEEYFSGTARVSPREFIARLNDLRDLIFSK